MPMGLPGGSGFNRGAFIESARRAIDAPAGIAIQQLNRVEEIIQQQVEEHGPEFLIVQLPAPPRMRIASSRSGHKTSDAQVEPQYNFFVENYQALVTNPQVAELQLPNIYNETLRTEIDPANSISFDRFEPDAITAEEQSLIIRPDLLERWNTLSDGKSQYPMYIETTFTTDVAGSISRLLEKIDLFPRVMNHFIHDSSNVNNSPSLSLRGVTEVFSFRDELETMVASLLDNTSSGCSSAREKLNLVIARQKIREILSKPAHRETLFYSIEKRVGGNRMQKIFVPNLAGINKFSYVDTQVKYDKLYAYSIKEHFIVSNGTSSYLASAQVGLDITEGRGEGATNRSWLAARIIDRPPVPPNVTLVPFRGIDNRILINLERMVDELVGGNAQKYISLLPGDQQIFERTHKAQKITNDELEKGHVEFKSEGADTTAIQVFRTTSTPSQPSPYKEFKDKLYTTVYASSGLSLMDDIKPNQEYFYTFRSVDRNGGISNPTTIYRVKIMNDRGLIVHDLDVYEPQPLPFKKRKRSFGREIYVKPSLLQTMVNDEGTEAGVLEDTVFGKKIKIRLTSKSTGRTVDLNLKFATKQ